MKRLEVRLIETISGIQRILPPTDELSTIVQFVQLSNDELRLLAQEMKIGWIAANNIRTAIKGSIKDILHSKSSKVRAAILLR